MKQRSRTGYSAVNTTVAVFSRIVAIFAGFVTRVVFTHMLNESYVGINGLFTDILNILSLTELGAGTAITYALYKPVADNNIPRQQALMQMFKWFYRLTAGCVAVFGILVIPFMDVIMKNRPDVEHLVLIYILYLVNSVASYLLVYKRTLIEAHQLNYIVLVYQTAFLLLQYICQILVLVIAKDFILFLVVHIICTIIGNICLSAKAGRLFPYLNKKAEEKLLEDEKRDIYRNIKAMLMHKSGAVIVNNTDNLIISSFVGVTSVGIYSNYFLVIGSVRQLLDQVFQGITASVGNLGATEDNSHVKKIFETAFFTGNWLYGFAAICLYELLEPFIETSFGSNYLFTSDITLVLCINFYINGTRKAALTFRDSLGLFFYDRYKAVAEALLNLVISIMLVKGYGVLGVFVGTLSSMVLVSVWVEPYILYKYHIMQTCSMFFAKYIIYALLTGTVWVLTDVVCQQVTGTQFFILAVRVLICIIIPNTLFTVFYHRTEEFGVIKEKARELIKRGQ
ncbi:MAG: lipopolysaccharide biosynthesis protein [Lachnospiraceae bacterium]|nr:lipopolysaccharide biosynthesis protein [Lachnospiraceae bacterium]